tara:strand:+ start:630 stop:1235 length:606 start_codon:yes stop_codon:yes gene_type:complete
MSILLFIIRELKDWIEYSLANIPGQTGIILRRFYFNKRLAKPSRGIRIETGIKIDSPKFVSIGSNSYLGVNCKIYASPLAPISIGSNLSVNSNVMINARGEGGIKIGNNVLIGPNVVIRSNNHCFSNPDVPITNQGMNKGEIIIEDDVWIASNSVVLPECRIGRGSIVAAGAVVTKDVPPFTVVGGYPAKSIGSRRQRSKD